MSPKVARKAIAGFIVALTLALGLITAVAPVAADDDGSVSWSSGDADSSAFPADGGFTFG